MSLASMKLKMALGTSVTSSSLAAVTMEVVAVHHHRDSRELNVHLRPVGAPEAGTVDLVLLGDDMERGVASKLKVGDHYRLTVAFTKHEPA